MINPYESPCYICVDVPCSKVCEPKALLPVESRLDIKLGFAAPTFHCLNQKENKKICDICQSVCPFSSDCITFNKFNIPVINRKLCTGCGICSDNCPEKGKAIIIFPK